MVKSKWIGGFLGFITLGPLGALAGYVLGAIFDADQQNDWNRQTEETGDYKTGERNSFLFSLLVMASYIIRADGRIMHSEMNYIRRFLRDNFGEIAVGEGETILLNLFERQKQMDAVNPMAFKSTIRECAMQIAANLSYEQRLQLLDFLAQIAKSDGNIVVQEIDALKEVAVMMGLSEREIDSILHMGGDNQLQEAYRILEIEPSASDDEVRAAYRKMALKHHPDKVASLGEDIRLAAEKKFQHINNAKEMIYKSRGLK